MRSGAHFALLLCAALFGATFIFQRHAAAGSTAMWFIAWRFAVGAVALVLAAGVLWRKHPPLGSWGKLGAISAALMFGGMYCQQWGLAHTTAGKSGFITGLYVVIVPFLVWLLGHKISARMWLSAVLSCLGLALFASVQGRGAAAWNIGDTVTLLGAFFWALQVLWTGWAVRRCDLLGFSMVQLLVVAIFAALWVALFSGLPALFNLQELRFAFWDLLFCGVGSSALAFFLQAYGQRRVETAPAAVIMSLESVFALFFGWLFLGEKVSIVMLLGCVALFVAMVNAALSET